jgi:hypothetical protein
MFSYNGRDGSYAGWIIQGKLLLPPISQPHYGHSITAW